MKLLDTNIHKPNYLNLVGMLPSVYTFLGVYKHFDIYLTEPGSHMFIYVFPTDSCHIYYRACIVKAKVLLNFYEYVNWLAGNNRPYSYDNSLKELHMSYKVLQEGYHRTLEYGLVK